MLTLTDFDSTIQASILHYAHPDFSYSDIGKQLGITKQAVAKKLREGREFFATYKQKQEFPEQKELLAAKDEVKRLSILVRHLQLQLVTYSITCFLLRAFKEAIQAFFPNFKGTRFTADQKKALIDYLAKYEKLGGSIKDFCKLISRSTETMRKWQAAFAEYGLAGLYDKKSRPHHLSNTIPRFLKDQLFLLFKRFPHWTPYQYYKYIRSHPAWSFPIAVSTIGKLKKTQVEKTAEEKERIKKRWAFAPSTDVWTVDFTCILKTENYKLQLLTVSDARSRFFFDTALYLETSTTQVMDHLQELFIKYGKPFMIKADNGPEFRLDCANDLNTLGVYLFNSPTYYGQFNGAHERIHRTLKTFITKFEEHHNISRLEKELSNFREEYNYHMCLDILDQKTPAEIFFCEKNFVPRDVEVVTPYEKDGEIRQKFTNRNGKPARMGLPHIEKASA